MITLSIIGSGNVAQHLIQAFSKSTEIELDQVFSRQKKNVAHLLDFNQITDDLSTLAAADLYVIAVSDAAIATVSSQLPFKNRLVVHTSGSVDLADLANTNRKGVFYPLQTFSKNKSVDFSIIPICLESEHPEDFDLLEKVAKSITNITYKLNTEQRKAIHVAAVFVNNFVNHLYQIGNQICTENHIAFDILKPLIEETAQKIITLSPIEAQTGPAKRKDNITLDAHLSFLSDDNQKTIYRILTQSIQNNGQKL